MNPKGSQEPCPIPMSYLESHYLSVFETTNDRILGECPLLHFTKMGKHPKSESISKQTPSKKSDKICKPTKSDRRKSKSTLQPIRQSLRLKPVNKQENFIEKQQQQEVIPQVYFGTASPFLQSVVLCHILENNFSMFDQIEMRRVCRLWHYNVKHIWAKTRSLVLEMKDEFSIKSKLSSDLDKQTNFNFKFDTTTTTTTNKVELTFGLRYWNNPTFDLLGDIFGNIEHLTIFYNINCTFNNTDQLCYLLQKFSKVKSFSLIIPKPAYVESNALSKLFETICNHQSQLHTLHIHLPSLKYYNNIPFPALKKEHFIKTLSSLENFSLNCSVENLGEMLKMIGQSITRIQSLGISVRNEKSLSPAATLFKQNPNLSQIKRLKLMDVNGSSLNIVNSLIDHLPELECLYLNEREEVKNIDFTTEWIQTLSKLSHLKELLLYDFEIQLLKDWMVKSLPTIRKLTIVESYCLRASIAYKYYQENEIEIDELVDPRLFYGRFLSCFAKQFPRLEQLTIRQTYSYEFDECFSSMCFTEFYHLKSLRLEGRDRGFTFTS